MGLIEAVIDLVKGRHCNYTGKDYVHTSGVVLQRVLEQVLDIIKKILLYHNKGSSYILHILYTRGEVQLEHLMKKDKSILST